MEHLTIQRQLGFTASSSQRLVQQPVSSGLPMQGSIAGCLSIETEPREWIASLMRLGHGQTRVMDAPPRVPVLLEENLYAEFASAIQENVWMERSGHRQTQAAGRMLSASAVHFSGVVSGLDHVYVFHLKRAASEESDTPEQEVPLADTDQPFTVQQMAHAWKTISKPIPEDDVSISVDPDDYPLF